jgi:hypothetical protein
MYLNSNDARTFSMFSEFFSGEVLSEIKEKGPASHSHLEQEIVIVYL